MNLKLSFMLLLGLALQLFAQKNIAIINDAAGFYYIKAAPSHKAKNIVKISKDQYFMFIDSLAGGEWVPVITIDAQQKGYIPKSKLRPLDQIKVKSYNLSTERVKHLKIQEKNLEKMLVRITEIATVDSGCNAWVDIYKDHKLIKSFTYKRMQSLSGIAGVTFLQKIDPSYLILVKHGDNDGKTLYIHKGGTILETKGGIATKMLHQRYILNFHECDQGYCGYSLLDLHTHRIIAEQPEVLITEVFEENDQLIFNTVADGYLLKRLNITTLKLEPFSQNNTVSLKPFSKFTPYEHDDPCFCNCEY
ncbi:MAG TPA: hypothetical protein VL947_09190 [Cytophagales bacterium]|nr:hypothetical protein [Cytophagales bacterium]